jgi:putative flippase GtrA
MQFPHRREISVLFGQLFKWGFLSGFSFFLNIGLLFTIHEFIGLSEEVAFALSLLTVFLANFIILRNYIFKTGESNWKRQFIYFFYASLCFRILEYLLFLILHSWFRTYYLLAAIIILGLSSISKFLFYRSFVFRKEFSG